MSLRSVLVVLAFALAGSAPGRAAWFELSSGLPSSDVEPAIELSPDGRYAVFSQDAVLDGVSDRWSVRILVAACLVGLTRFLLLGHWSLWLDEAFTLADARHSRGSLNPLGYVVFNLWFALGGGRPDELWMRLPAAVKVGGPAGFWARSS